MRPRSNDIGIRYWKLVVLSVAPKTQRNMRLLCRCDCWNDNIVYKLCLRNGDTTSCWCYWLERRIASRKTHWLSQTPLYIVWKDIIRRCSKPNNSNYKYYGWRGITCAWDTIESFIADMSEWYEKWLQIDRIDCDGNYKKENCRWVTAEINNQNRRNLLMPWGLAKYCRENNMIYSTIQSRLNRWISLEKSLL